MSDLANHVDEYLRMRRSFGFKLVFPGRVLPEFVAHVEAAGTDTITVELAIEWAGSSDAAPIVLSHRLGAVRGFARYMTTIDPATQVPPAGVWPSTATRPAPYVWSDTEIRALLNAAGGLSDPLRAATYETLFGLLAACGMRIGEALGLARTDVDLERGVITINDAKFGRSRFVPMHPTTTDALGAYLTRRNRLCPRADTASLFVSSRGSALAYRSVHTTFIDLSTTIGVRTDSVRPRIHDIRHSFAVRTLINWHRAGADIETRMPALSNYLGHTNPSGTYWYLTAVPELMELAAARLDTRGRP